MAVLWTGSWHGSRRSTPTRWQPGASARQCFSAASLIPTCERVGDVDLAVEIVPLHQLTKEQFDAAMRRWIRGRRRVQPGEPMLAVRCDAAPQGQKSSVLRLLELDGEHVV